MSFNLKNLKTLNWAYIFLSIVILLFLFVRLRHLDIAFERDEGEYAYAGQSILRGELPYRDFYNMKMPGVYFIYALMMKIGGESVKVVHFGLLLVNLATAFFTFLTAKRLFNKETGIYAAGIYLLFCLSFGAQGWTANAEHFVNLFAMAGLWAATEGYSSDKKAWLFLSGFLMMCAYTCKQHGFGYVILVPFWFLSTIIWHFKDKKVLLNYIKNMSVYAAGGVVTVGLVLLYIFNKNIENEFYHLTFEYAFAYASRLESFTEIWHFRPIFWDACFFWFLFFAAMYFLLKNKIQSEHKGFIFISFACVFISLSAGLLYRPHYFQLIFPVAAIVTALGLNHITDFWNIKWITPQSWALAGVLCYGLVNPGYLFFDSSAKVVQDAYADDFHEWREIGKFLPKILDKNATIAQIGAEPELNFYSKIKSATGFMYHHPLYENQKFAARMTETFIKEIEDNKPEVLIYQCMVDHEQYNPSTMVRVQNWFNKYLENYDLIGVKFGENGKHETQWALNGEFLKVPTTTDALIYKRKEIRLLTNK